MPLWGRVINANSLNVRKGPGRDYDVVNSLSLGTLIEILDSFDGWYKIQTRHAGDIGGWVSKKYVVTLPLEGFVKSDHPVREGPGTNFPVVAWVTAGVEFIVLGESLGTTEGWYIIKLETKKGTIQGWIQDVKLIKPWR